MQFMDFSLTQFLFAFSYSLLYILDKNPESKKTGPLWNFKILFEIEITYFKLACYCIAFMFLLST